MKHHRYEYSVQIRILPCAWAKRDHTRRANLLAMLQSHTTAVLHAAYTSERCTSCPKPGQNKSCYAFINVGNEREGNKFIQDITQVQVVKNTSRRGGAPRPSRGHPAQHIVSGTLAQGECRSGTRSQGSRLEAKVRHMSVAKRARGASKRPSLTQAQARR